MCNIRGVWESVGLRPHIRIKGWGPIRGISRIYGGVGKNKWVGIMRFDDTWWTRGHGMFYAHEDKALLGIELQIGPI
jgi:hypothetical protein